MTTTSSWIARDACERDDCTMRPYQHRHLADGTPEPAVADCQMSEAIARATTLGDDRGRELAELANDIGNLRDGPLDEMRERARALAASVQKRAHDATARALAAPAETDVDTETALARARAEHDADHLGLSTPWCPWCYPPADSTRPPAPEGEAGSLPAPLGDLASWLRAAAAGRREYAERAPEDQAAVLHIQASTLDGAARLATGDASPMHWWLPSWRWGELWSADPPVEEIDRNRHGLPVYAGDDWTVESDPEGDVHVFVSDDSHPGAGREYVFEPDVTAAIAAARRDPAPAPPGLQAQGAGETAGDRTVNDPPGFLATWCRDCSTVGGHDIDCPRRPSGAGDEAASGGGGE